MFAQFPDYALSPWATWTSNGSLVAIVIYLVTKGIPSLIEKFTQNSREERNKFSEILTDQRNDFKAEMAAEREEQKETNMRCHSAIEKMSDNIQNLSDKMVTVCPNQRERAG